jgi:hypothetical protein
VLHSLHHVSASFTNLGAHRVRNSCQFDSKGAEDGNQFAKKGIIAAIGGISWRFSIAKHFRTVTRPQALG